MSKKNEQETILSGMMDLHWKRRSDDEVFKFIKYKKKDEDYLVSTDKEDLHVNYFDLKLFMSEFTEVTINAHSGEATVVKKELPAKNKVKVLDTKNTDEKKDVVKVESTVLATDTLKYLKEVMLENIKKVQADKAYVPQAKEISNSVGQLINLAKVELDMITKL